MIIPHHDKSRKRKKKNLTKKLSIFNAYINFKLSKVSNSRDDLVLNLAKKIREFDINILGIKTDYIRQSDVKINLEMEIEDLESIFLIKEFLKEFSGKSNIEIKCFFGKV